MDDILTHSEGVLFAHSLPDKAVTEWEWLDKHLLAVGELAGRYGARFGAGEAAAMAGYLHDIGKASEAFQRYIRGDGSSPDHSTAGAVVADGLFSAGPDGWVARLVALAIAGHHAGLADGTDLAGRLARPLPDYGAWRGLALPLQASILPRLSGASLATPGYRFAFLGRMIFSCLVDADFIATERFYVGANGSDAARGDHTPLSGGAVRAGA